MSNGTTTDYVVWQAQYALGHDTIDQQHQGIVTILNQLYEAIRSGTEEGHMQMILDKVCSYAETHLVYEEALLTEIGYPDLAEHRRRHAEWRSEAQRFQARFRTDGGKICHDVFLMARKWWLGHIQGEDRKYQPYLPGVLPSPPTSLASDIPRHTAEGGHA